MGWEAGIPAGFDENARRVPPTGIKSTYTRQGSEPNVDATPGRRPHSSRLEGGEDGRALGGLCPVIARRWQTQQPRHRGCRPQPPRVGQ
jgi:hypothetical protein